MQRTNTSEWLIDEVLNGERNEHLQPAYIPLAWPGIQNVFFTAPGLARFLKTHLQNSYSYAVFVELGSDEKIFFLFLNTWVNTWLDRLSDFNNTNQKANFVHRIQK